MGDLIKLAFQYMKVNKGKTILTSICILSSVFLLSSLVLFRNANYDYIQRQNLNSFGDYQLFTNIEDDNNIDSSIPKENIDEEVTVYDYAVSKADDGSYIDVKNINTKTNMHIIPIWEGNLPVKSNEVLISREFAKKHNLKVGDTFNLSIGSRTVNNVEVPHYETNFVENEIYTEKEVLYNLCVSGLYIPALPESNTAIKDEMITYTNKVGVSGQRYIKLKTISKEKWNTMKETLVGVNVSPYGEELLTNSVDRQPLVKIQDYIIGFVFIMLLVFLYNIFKITQKEKIKYLGILKSIGATNIQVYILSVIETLLYFIFLFPIAFVSSFIATSLILKQLDVYNSWVDMFSFQYRLILNPLEILGIACVILFILLCSSSFAIFKLCKYEPIQMIRDNVQEYQKKIRPTSLIENIFGIEALIGTRNRKHNRAGQRPLAIAVTLCFVLLFTGTFYLNETSYKENSNAVLVTYKSVKTLKEYMLLQNEFRSSLKEIDTSEFLMESSIQLHNVSFPKELLSDEVNKLIESGALHEFKIVGVDTSNAIFENNVQGILHNQSTCSSELLSGATCSFFRDGIKELSIPNINLSYHIIEDTTGFLKQSSLSMKKDRIPTLYVSKDAMISFIERMQEIDQTNYIIESSAIFYGNTTRSIYNDLEKAKLKNKNLYLEIHRRDENPDAGIDNSLSLTLYGITIIILIVCGINLLCIIICNALYMKRNNMIINSLGIEVRQNIKLLFFEQAPMLIKCYIVSVIISIVVCYVLSIAYLKREINFTSSSNLSILIISLFCLMFFIDIIISIVLQIIKRTNMIESLRRED